MFRNPLRISFTLLCLLIATGAYAQVRELTTVFQAGGVAIDRLLVYDVGGIVLIRGRTSDPALALEASRFAQSLGDQRIANLIEIVPGLGDGSIERFAGRQLVSQVGALRMNAKRMMPDE
jgi:hypothetical protein